MLTQPSLPELPPPSTPPYPDAGWACKRRYPGFPVYGLYAYADSWRRHRQDIQDTGWSHLRLGGPVTKADMADTASDGLSASVHIADGPKRNEYGSDEAFLSDAVTRAGHRLDRYPTLEYAHVWNEPNGGYMWDGVSLLEKADLYGKLLTRVGALVREKRPDVKILGFELARPGQNAVQFTRLCYQLHPKVHQAYDIYALHPGVDPTPPESKPRYHWGEDNSIAETVRDIRGVFRRQPPDLPRRKPIWFTEAGWKISKQDGGRYDMPPGVTVSPVLQAAYACRGYAQALRLGVKRWTTFFVEDTDKSNSGFFNADGSWRLSAQAVQVMIGLMPRPRLFRVLRDGDEGVYAYTFLRDAEHPITPATMAWNVEGPKTIELSLGLSSVTITNMLRESVLAASPSGVYTVEVGPLPVYLT